MAEEIINKIGFHELIEKATLSDEDIIVLEDNENTKRISFKNLRASLIDDDELPSKNRIYSSEKLDTAIQNFDQKLNYDIGLLEGSIKNISETMITEQSVDKKIENFSKLVPELAEVETIKNAVESKRNTSDPITCDDIESGEDAKKIQERNLSKDLLNKIAGNAPVSIANVPEGGWVQEDIANEAINGSKLSRQYRYKGHYTYESSANNINQFISDGLYLLGGSIVGLPKYDMNEGELDRLLEVYNYGPDQNIVQRLYYCTDNSENSRPVYVRKAPLSRLANTEFVAEFTITDKYKITRNILDDDIFNGGVIDSGSVFDLDVDNDYLVKKTVSGLPNDKYDFTVSVRQYDSRIEYTAKCVTTALCEVYVCNSYLLTDSTRARTPWYETNSVKKSRLEGTRVHLFGDGVCFGLGSTDIPVLSYPALLNSRYGIKITNHALGDATIGIYGDDYLDERSVITQIENANLDGDIAIIFAGSNDYKSSLSKIGNNTDSGTSTIKGALNNAIQKLIDKKPDIKILVITPLFRARLNADDFRNSDDAPINELYLKDYATAMKEICEYHHIPCLDLHNTSMINKFNFSSYLKDRFYLNDKGHDMIANKIFSALDYFY